MRLSIETNLAAAPPSAEAAKAAAGIDVQFVEDEEILTPVQERREYFENAFKRDSHHHSTTGGDESAIQHGLVNDRLQWIAEEKRKSLSQSSPNNKDAVENIPPHLVEGRKKWLRDQMKHMTLHQQQVFMARMSKHYKQWMNLSQDEEEKPLQQQQQQQQQQPDLPFQDITPQSADDVPEDEEQEDLLLPRRQEPYLYSTKYPYSKQELADALQQQDLMVDTLCEEKAIKETLFEDESMIEVTIEQVQPVDNNVDNLVGEHPEEPPRLGGPKIRSSRSTRTGFFSSSSVLPQNTVKSAPVYYSPQMPVMAKLSSPTSTPLSTSSLADYARQSCQTMARARLPVAPFFDEELIIRQSNTNQILSPMSMSSPGQRFSPRTLPVDGPIQDAMSMSSPQSTELRTLGTALSSAAAAGPCKPPLSSKSNTNAKHKHKQTATTTKTTPKKNEATSVQCDACCIL